MHIYVICTSLQQHIYQISCIDESYFTYLHSEIKDI